MFQSRVDRLPGLRPSRVVSFVIFALVALGALALPPRPALAACGSVTSVGTEAALAAAITDFNGQAGPCDYFITLSADITLTADLPLINNTGTGVLFTVDGDGHTISDDGTGWLGLRVLDSEGTIQNLTLLNQQLGLGIEGSMVSVENTTVTNSFDTGINIYQSTVTLSNVVSSDNGFAGVQAGESTLTVLASTVANNFLGIGGFSSDIALFDSTLSGNGDGLSGGDIDVFMANSTVAANDQAGLYLEAGNLWTINTTIADNGDGLVFTVFDDDLGLRIDNSILAGNSDNDCTINPFGTGLIDLSIRYSLFSDSGDDACGLAAANPDGDGNIVGEPPLLAPLADYGGPTQTIALLALGGSVSAVSPAIDSGDNGLAVIPGTGPLEFDQRGNGFPRIFNNTVDMGAFEGVIPILCPAFPATVTTEGELNIAIVCYNAITTPGAYTVTFGNDITLATGTIPVNNATGGVSLIIDGAGQTLDGDDIPGVRPLTIQLATTVTVRNLTVTGGNIANLLTPNDGGGISNAGTLTLERVTITGNATRDDGGGLFNDDTGTVTIVDSIISDNTAGLYDDDDAPGDGGGINNEGVMTITDSVISGNQALGNGGIYGGGIFNEGDLTLTRTTVSNNEVRGSELELYGGGIVNQASLVIRDSSIINNRVTGLPTESEAAGGGIYSVGDFSDVDAFGAQLTLINSTVSGNRVSGGTFIYGGGIYISSRDLDFDMTTEVTLGNTTVSNNEVQGDGQDITGGGGGVYITKTDGSTLVVSIANSILANSTTFTTTGSGGQDCVLEGDVTFGSIHTLYEATGAGACGVTNGADGNLTGIDPLLGALGNNGGPTLTHLPGAGSPAIDSGLNALAVDVPSMSPLTADQRGFTPRIVNGTVDRGSVEVGAQPPVAGFCPVDDPAVGNEMTTLLGRGMGSPTRALRQALVTIPNAGDVTALYGQLAAVDVGTMKSVRFDLRNGTVLANLTTPTSPAYRQAAVDWWGAELGPQSHVRGKFFPGLGAARAARGLVLWPTYETETSYANVLATFDNSATNHVYWGAGWVPTQTQTLDIPETQAAGADITVHIALVDNQPDERPVVLTVTPLPGGTPVQVVLLGPNVPGKPKTWQNTLNLEEIVLADVPAGVNQVQITLTSPNPFNNQVGTGATGGDSVAMIGAAAGYACGDEAAR